MPRPSASSTVVWNTEAPEPAFSGGTALMARWLHSAARGEVPSMTTHIARKMGQGPLVAPASTTRR
jgi:hypothetical protein